jgi:hypothetical protein
MKKNQYFVCLKITTFVDLIKTVLVALNKLIQLECNALHSTNPYSQKKNNLCKKAKIVHSVCFFGNTNKTFYKHNLSVFSLTI